MCVCVCVCVREREREREGGGEGVLHSRSLLTVSGMYISGITPQVHVSVRVQNFDTAQFCVLPGSGMPSADVTTMGPTNTSGTVEQRV